MPTRFPCKVLVAISCISMLAIEATAFEEVQIAEIFSNACGTQQFIELDVPDKHGGLDGREIRIFDRDGNLTRTLTVTSDVFDESRLLIATPELLAASGVAAEVSVATLNAGDIDIGGGAIWFGCCGDEQDVDVILYGNYAGPFPPPGTGTVTGGSFEPLPTDGRSIVRLMPGFEFGDAIPTPTNNDAQQGTLPKPGDINADSVVESIDADIMVQVLLGNDTGAAHLARADLDCDGSENGLDIQLMTDALTPASNVLPECSGIIEPYVSITYDSLETFVPFTGPQPQESFLTWAVTALDIPNVVVAHAKGQLWASVDDGCTWFSIGLTDQSGGLYRIEAGPLGYAYAWLDNQTGSGPEAGIYQIHNFPPGSTNFEVTFVPAPVNQMNGFGVDPFNPHHIRTGNNNGELRDSMNSGFSWNRIGVPASTATVLTYVFEFDPNDLDHVIYGRHSEGAYVTTNGGESWTQSDGLRSIPTRGNNFFSATISPLDGNMVYGMGIDLGETGLPGDPPAPPSRGKHIYASTDGGLTFSPVLSQGTGGGEPGEGVFMQNQPVMKSDWRNPTKFHYLFGVSCAFGGTRFYSYDLNTGIIETAIRDEANGCIPNPHQFEWSRTNPDALLMGFGFTN